MKETYLTQSQAAEILHVSTRTLERKRSEGTGPRFYKFGARVLYSVNDLDDWLRGNSFKSTSEYHDGN